MTEYKLTIKHTDGDETVTSTWRTVSPEAEYDAIHAVAGALIAGAESVSVVKEE